MTGHTPSPFHMGDYGAWRWKGEQPDWQHVVTIDPGCGYDWTTLHAFWSPSQRRYFWQDGSGCSCESWGDDIESQADMQNGDRNDLLRAIRAFTETNDYAISGAEELRAVDAVRTFKEARNV